MAAFLDCGDDSSGTVGALDGPEVSDSDYVLEAKPAAPGPGPGYRGRVSLEESLGAVFGWVWCKYIKSFSWSMLYWPALEYCGEPPQVSAVRAGGIWSGYMSEARGLSWDRKSRKGKK
jgi:hypothetical protein